MGNTQGESVGILALAGRIQIDLRERDRLPEIPVLLQREMICGGFQPAEVHGRVPGLVPLRGAQVDIAVIVWGNIPVAPVRDDLRGQVMDQRRLLVPHVGRIHTEQMP